MNKATLLIPMAGAGSRFQEKGYKEPKPLINVFEKPMIDWVINNFHTDIVEKYVFIIRKEHNQKYDVANHLKKVTNNNCDIVEIDYLTEGAACTTLLAEKYINNDSPLLLANSDQFVLWDSTKFFNHASQFDGSILTFESVHPKWSYAKVDSDNLVLEVAEKKPISTHATVGIYYWKSGKEYVSFAKQMIEKNIRTNNEFYVCPVFNEAILGGKKISIHEINQSDMWGLGTPEDLEYFLQNFKEQS